MRSAKDNYMRHASDVPCSCDINSYITFFNNRLISLVSCLNFNIDHTLRPVLIPSSMVIKETIFINSFAICMLAQNSSYWPIPTHGYTSSVMT